MGVELDCPVTLGSVTLVRVKSARVTDIWIDDQHEIDEIVFEYDRKQFHRLVYVAISRVIFNTLFNIIRV